MGRLRSVEVVDNDIDNKWRDEDCPPSAKRSSWFVSCYTSENAFFRVCNIHSVEEERDVNETGRRTTPNEDEQRATARTSYKSNAEQGVVLHLIRPVFAGPVHGTTTLGNCRVRTTSECTTYTTSLHQIIFPYTFR